MCAPNVTQDAATITFADLDQSAEGVQCRGYVAGLLGYNHELITRLAIGKHDAKAVENSTAHGRKKPEVDAILIREHQVTVGFQDLQLVHARSKSGQHARLSSSEDRRPSAKELLPLRVAPHFGCSTFAFRPHCSGRAH